MHKFRQCIRLVAIGGIMAALAADSFAQNDGRPGTNASQQDVFASVHANLADAADRTLAAALEDRPWMKNDVGSPAAAPGAPTNMTGPVTRLRAAVDRVRQLRPIVEPILREEGVPLELSAVMLVESGGIASALSPKGARGVWQFMPETARRYGLVVSERRDDRLDVSRSTHAAARYLRDLYRKFGNWPLAFAAYNAGEYAVDRALGRTGHRDFLAIQQVLPQETRKYVPSVLQGVATLGGNANVFSRGQGAVRGRVIYAFVQGED